MQKLRLQACTVLLITLALVYAQVIGQTLNEHSEQTTPVQTQQPKTQADDTPPNSAPIEHFDDPDQVDDEEDFTEDDVTVEDEDIVEEGNNEQKFNDEKEDVEDQDDKRNHDQQDQDDDVPKTQYTSDFEDTQQEQDSDSIDQEQKDEDNQDNSDNEVDNNDSNSQNQRQGDQIDQKDVEFKTYKSINNRRYQSPSQQVYRYGVFKKNQQIIKNNNANSSKSYELGNTQFSDYSLKEFKQYNLVSFPGEMPKSQAPPMKAPTDFKWKAVDWRYQGSMPMAQEKCGSCWALAIVSLIQTYVNIIHGKLYEFSPQQTIDCCKDKCRGCKGGWPASAMNHYAEAGIALKKDYPYLAKKQDCRLDDQSIPTIKVLDQQLPFLQLSGVQQLRYALQSGPVSVILDSTTWSPLYKNGQFDDCPQSNFNFNHAVNIVGIKSDGVWVVRNTWGPTWGQLGHIFLSPGNSCGVAEKGVIPVILQNIQ